MSNHSFSDALNLPHASLFLHLDMINTNVFRIFFSFDRSLPTLFLMARNANMSITKFSLFLKPSFMGNFRLVSILI